MHGAFIAYSEIGRTIGHALTYAGVYDAGEVLLRTILLVATFALIAAMMVGGAALSARTSR